MLLHFAAILITFCVNITFCGDYYILRRNTALGVWTQYLDVIGDVRRAVKFLKDGFHGSEVNKHRRVAVNQK